VSLPSIEAKLLRKFRIIKNKNGRDCCRDEDMDTSLQVVHHKDLMVAAITHVILKLDVYECRESVCCFIVKKV